MIDRTNTSPLGRWWWTIDRPIFICVLTLVAIGMVLSMAASPAIAEHIGAEPFYFVKRHVVFMSMAVCVIYFVSTLPVVTIRRICAVGLLGAILALILVLIAGTEIKGAQRWLVLGGISIQPSEFMKPLFIVMTAWLLTRANMEEHFRGREIGMGLYALIALLLVLQPDFGMTVVITTVFVAQLVIAGLPVILIMVAGALMVGGGVMGYLFLPHVTRRIDGFINPNSVDNYQVATSLRAFMNGGFFGRGPGQGQVKLQLPDAHTDFIFAVAGEELGIITCLLIVGLFATIIVRTFRKLMIETDLFKVYATAGLIIQFSLQAIVNMGVSVGLIPNKGITLPFVSYGGSSSLATAFAMGMILAFTRKQFGQGTAQSGRG